MLSSDLGGHMYTNFILKRMHVGVLEYHEYLGQDFYASSGLMWQNMNPWNPEVD